MILQQHANKVKMEGISTILIKVKVRSGLTVNDNGVPSILIGIPLIPRKCVLFAHHPYLSCSLFLTFLSLESACFSPIAHVCLAHFFLSSRL
jgi:purine-cytosine permease-like protein